MRGRFMTRPVKAWIIAIAANQERSGNEMIARICAGDPRLTYVDVATPMLTLGTPPPSELFASDGMHPSPEGYALLTNILRPRLLTPHGVSWNMC